MNPNRVSSLPQLILMKKLLLLAAGFAAISLGACNRQVCPADSNSRAAVSVPQPAAPVMASAATPGPRQ